MQTSLSRSEVRSFLPHFSAFPDLNLAWFTVFNAAWHISLASPDPSHLLPILTGVITFLQMRIAQPINIAQTKEAMQHMQVILPLVMVAVTIFFAWQIAAGVALYRFVWLGLNMALQFIANGQAQPACAVNASRITESIRQEVAPQPTSRTVKKQNRKRSAGRASARRRRW